MIRVDHDMASSTHDDFGYGSHAMSFYSGNPHDVILDWLVELGKTCFFYDDRPRHAESALFDMRLLRGGGGSTRGITWVAGP